MIVCERKLIHRHDGDPYLWRLDVISCRWFGVYLHQFVSSDDECLHDHPWPFVTIILRGGYYEHVGHWWHTTWSGRAWLSVTRRWHRAGSVLFRRPTHAHRIEIDPARPAVSLVIRGPRVRPWGFFTKIGWLHWTRYRYAEHCS